MSPLDPPPAAPAPAVAPPRTRPWRRFRRRTVLLAALLIAVLLVPVADVVARQATEHAVASKMQKELATAERPDVSLGGTPFLTQLISRRLDSITLDVKGAKTCKMRMEHMHAEMTGVRRSGDQVRADSVRGKVLLSYTDLNAALAPLRLSGGSDGRVTISAGGSFLGASATGLPRIENGNLVIEAEGVTATLGGQTVLDGSLAALPEMRVPLREIPQNLTLNLTPNAEGLALTFDGADVRMDTASCPST